MKIPILAIFLLFSKQVFSGNPNTLPKREEGGAHGETCYMATTEGQKERNCGYGLVCRVEKKDDSDPNVKKCLKPLLEEGEKCLNHPAEASAPGKCEEGLTCIGIHCSKSN